MTIIRGNQPITQLWRNSARVNLRKSGNLERNIAAASQRKVMRECLDLPTISTPMVELEIGEILQKAAPSDSEVRSMLNRTKKIYRGVTGLTLSFDNNLLANIQVMLRMPQKIMDKSFSHRDQIDKLREKAEKIQDYIHILVLRQRLDEGGEYLKTKVPVRKVGLLRASYLTQRHAREIFGRDELRVALSLGRGNESSGTVGIDTFIHHSEPGVAKALEKRLDAQT